MPISCFGEANMDKNIVVQIKWIHFARPDNVQQRLVRHTFWRSFAKVLLWKTIGIPIIKTQNEKLSRTTTC